MSIFKPAPYQTTSPYMWARELSNIQSISFHWNHLQLNFTEDIKAFLTEDAKIKDIMFRILSRLTQGDVDVAKSYREISSKFCNPDICMMIMNFAQIETVHMQAYARIPIEVCPHEADKIFQSFKDHQTNRETDDFLQSFTQNTDIELAIKMATFSGFMEGLVLFSLFAILYHISTHKKDNKPTYTGMGQVVEYSIRDETLHTIGMIKLYHKLIEEVGIDKNMINQKIIQICNKMIDLECDCIDFLFGDDNDEIYDLHKQTVKDYVYYLAEIRLNQLEIYDYTPATDRGITNQPIPVMDDIVNKQNLNDFFISTSNQYQDIKVDVNSLDESCFQ